MCEKHEPEPATLPLHRCLKNSLASALLIPPLKTGGVWLFGGASDGLPVQACPFCGEWLPVPGDAVTEGDGVAREARLHELAAQVRETGANPAAALEIRKLAGLLFTRTVRDIIDALLPWPGEDKAACSVCGARFSLEHEGGMAGAFGILPVQFCPWCYSSLADMAEQLFCPGCEHKPAPEEPDA
jgi:hypothetical protein